MKHLKQTVLAVAAVAALTACSSASPAPDQEAVRYDSPPFQGTSFAKCVQPGGYDMAAPWTGADFYAYPAGQRTYQFTGDGKNADAPAFTANTQDGVEMTVSGVVAFRLTDDCDRLREFHERIGLKDAAYITDDGAGWAKVLNKFLGSSIQRAVNDATQGRAWRALYADPKVKGEWEQQVKTLLPKYVEQAAGGPYFDQFSVTIQKPEIPADLSDALRATQVAVEQTAAQQKRNEQVTSELESIKALVAVLGPEGYNTYSAIKSGKIQVLPVPAGSPVLVQPKAGQ